MNGRMPSIRRGVNERYTRRRRRPCSGNAGRFSWEDLVPNHYARDEINEAFAKMRAREDIKPVIDPA